MEYSTNYGLDFNTQDLQNYFERAIRELGIDLSMTFKGIIPCKKYFMITQDATGLKYKSTRLEHVQKLQAKAFKENMADIIKITKHEYD
jgi:hypothetical protein